MLYALSSPHSCITHDDSFTDTFDRIASPVARLHGARRYLVDGQPTKVATNGDGYHRGFIDWSGNNLQTAVS